MTGVKEPLLVDYADVMDGFDRMITRRAELLAEADRLGAIIAEIRDKAAARQRPAKTTPRKPRTRRKAGLPDASEPQP